MEKITLTQAANMLGLHPNTLKNWQKAGKLPNAEKLMVKGKPVWFVDLDEVRDVANNEQPIYQTVPNTQTTQQEPLDEPPATPQRPPAANNTGAIELWQETFLAPLQKANSELLVSNDAKTKRIDELSFQLGILTERVRSLEASQAAQDATRLSESPPTENTSKAENASQTDREPSPVLNSDTLQPNPPKKRRWWQF